MRSIYEHQIDVLCRGNWIYTFLATCVNQVQHIHTVAGSWGSCKVITLKACQEAAVDSTRYKHHVGTMCSII